jgi:hypothetical protein
MADLIVITPSRGRPRQLNELAHAVAETTSGRAEVLGLVDLDDPDRAAYKALSCRIWTGPRASLSAWTNYAATNLVGPNQLEPPRYLASLGDDHRPRTMDWDRHLIDAIEQQLDGPGIAYGNDLLQGAALPTAWVVSAEVVRAVGWMMLPSCEHMYVDAAVLALGEAAGRIAYVPSVIIEHLHPIAGKAAWDDSYRASNSGARYAADAGAYEAWRRDGLAADAAKVSSLRAPVAAPHVNRFELTITAEAEVVRAPQLVADGTDR